MSGYSNWGGQGSWLDPYTTIISTTGLVIPCTCKLILIYVLLKILQKNVEFACTHDREIPYTQLTAALHPDTTKRLPSCAYPISLRGAKYPEKLNISLDAFIPPAVYQQPTQITQGLESLTQPPQQSAIGKQSYAMYMYIHVCIFW